MKVSIFSDETGNTYGRLIVLSLSSVDKKGNYRWLCGCSCGNQSVVRKDALRSKIKPTRSCGCLGAEMRKSNGKRSLKHGLSHSHPLYYVWAQMRRRCLKPSSDVWNLYRGRGISVCDAWSDFSVFLRDMGDRPEGMSLDRIDNDQGYSPENCRWATSKEQCNNKRTPSQCKVDYLNYQTGLQFVAALIGPKMRMCYG